jgi:V/A-type H+-transporting ATPase subunit F
MGRILALVDEETAAGFRLAGIEARPADTPEAMSRGVQSAMEDRETRLVILDEALFRKLPERLVRRLEESGSPIFFPIPTIRLWRGAAKPEEYVARLIRRAIGYQIKIRR